MYRAFYKRRYVFIILMFIFFTFFLIPRANAATAQNFVQHVYLSVLGREPDTTGLNYWTSMLSSNKITGGELIRNFLTGTEYANKNLNNEEYISMLYKTLLGRMPDPSGLNWCLSLLNNGYSRNRVFADIANSSEFKTVCNGYGIKPGYITLSNAVDLRPDLVRFVTNFYRVAFNREPDSGGLNYYVTGLATNKINGADLARSCFFCPEFNKYNYDDVTFIKKLYNGLYNRGVDNTGLSWWINLLSKHYSRYSVFANIVNSSEYTSTCNKFGITRGSITLTDPVDTRPDLNNFIWNIYTIMLGRQPDDGGLHYYVSSLATNKINGAVLAEFVTNSQEFINRNVGNEDFIRLVYKAFLERDADPSGLAYWNGMLSKYYSRHYILGCIINSQEFLNNICKKYNIKQGHINTLLDYSYSYYNITLQDMVNKQYDIVDPPPQTDVDSYGNYLGKWVNATKDQIAYYVDPSNFFDNDGMLQFLKLNYTPGITAVDLNNILQGKGVLSGQGQTFLDAAYNNNINPIYLVSHALLETGGGTSNLASGKILVNGKPTYNVFGIAANDRDPEKNGSEYAYNHGWFTIEDAINGGAEIISKDYINNSYYHQNTLYKMRWNPYALTVSPYEPTHQYASDIGWAVKQINNIKKILDNCKNIILSYDIPKYL